MTSLTADAPADPRSAPGRRRTLRSGAVAGLLGVLLLGGFGCPPFNPPGPEGALVVVPLLTGGAGRIADDAATTFATFTNAQGTPLRLAVEVISGDPGEAWRSASFVCDLVGGATATFTMEPAGAGSRITAECQDLNLFGFPKTVVVIAEAENGIVLAAAMNPATGTVVGQDRIIAEATVVDFGAGEAFVLPAVRVRGRPLNDGNQIYRFDGLEYSRLPAGVRESVVLPGPGESVELVLFTLDGTPGRTPPPRVALGGLGKRFGFDLLGQPTVDLFDFSHVFDCFDVVDLLALSGGFAGPAGTDASLQLTAKPVSPPGLDVHDVIYGDGTGSRRRPVLGWIVERRALGTVGGLLGQLTNRVVPFGADDQPTFDGQSG